LIGGAVVKKVSDPEKFEKRPLKSLAAIRAFMFIMKNWEYKNAFE
jgi:hypothetical protein